MSVYLLSLFLLKYTRFKNFIDVFELYTLKFKSRSWSWSINKLKTSTGGADYFFLHANIETADRLQNPPRARLNLLLEARRRDNYRGFYTCICFT